MIVCALDKMMIDKKIRGKDLADLIGMSEVNLSRIKSGKAKAIRFSTLEPLCQALHCQPGDLLQYVPDKGILQES